MAGGLQRVANQLVQVVDAPPSDPVVANAFIQVIMNGIPPPPAPVIPTTNMFARGGKPIWKCPNMWDKCLEAETGFWRAWDFTPRHGCRPSTVCVDPGDPWVDLPENGREYYSRGSVLASNLAAGVDTLVCQYFVPTGYDAIIYGLHHTFAGVGWVDADGNLIWRVRINQRWVKDLAAMVTRLGDLNTPYVLADRIYLHTQSIVSYWVNSANPLALQQNARVLAGFMGWVYPMQEGR